MSTQFRTSRQIAEQTLADFLQNFDIFIPKSTGGVDVVFHSALPDPQTTESEKLNLALIGAIPAAANAVTAAEIFRCRGGPGQRVEVDLRRGHNYIDPDIGMTPTLNGQEISLDVVVGNPFLRNIYQTKDDKYVVLSAVYVDLVYQWTAFLGCSVVESDVEEKVKSWTAEVCPDLEAACAAAGLPIAICQTEETWQQNPQGAHLSKLPWVPSAEQPSSGVPSPSPSLPRNPSRPLSDVRVLCVTHAIAGPSAGRTLAEHGASVLQVMFTHGFEHNFVYTYANLGTASTRLNLHKKSDRDRLQTLIKDAHVWIDSYRPDAIAKFGFSDSTIYELNPSMIVCRTRCYGTSGPWSDRPGFDMQGSASSGMMGFMGEGEDDGAPCWPPGMVINDYTTGYAAALAIQGIILKRLQGKVNPEHGWLLSPSLTGTAMGILKYFKTSRFDPPSDQGESEALPPEILEGQTGLGWLRTLAPLPKMSVTPIFYENELLSAMGSNRPSFPGYDDGYSTKDLTPMTKREFAFEVGLKKINHLVELKELGDNWEKGERRQDKVKYKL